MDQIRSNAVSVLLKYQFNDRKKQRMICNAKICSSVYQIVTELVVQKT